MADRRSLGMLGFLLGGVTAAVMLIAAMVVKHHVDGRVPLVSHRAQVRFRRGKLRFRTAGDEENRHV